MIIRSLETIVDENLVLVMGESGSGKTYYVNNLFKSLNNEGIHCVYLKQFPLFRSKMKLKLYIKLLSFFIDIELFKVDLKGFGIGLEIRFEELSGGQRKFFYLLLIKNVVLNNSDINIVIMDEPFAGISYNNVNKIIELMRIIRKKVKILCITHDFIKEMEKMTKNIIIFRNWEIYSTTMEIKTGEDLRETIIEQAKNKKEFKFFYLLKCEMYHFIMNIFDELLFSFILYSIFTTFFVGLYCFGEDKVIHSIHKLLIWENVIGGMISAYISCFSMILKRNLLIRQEVEIGLILNTNYILSILITSVLFISLQYSIVVILQLIFGVWQEFIVKNIFIPVLILSTSFIIIGFSSKDIFTFHLKSLPILILKFTFKPSLQNFNVDNTSWLYYLNILSPHSCKIVDEEFNHICKEKNKELVNFIKVIPLIYSILIYNLPFLIKLIYRKKKRRNKSKKWRNKNSFESSSRNILSLAEIKN